MINRFSPFFVYAWLLVLAGCASVPTQQTSVPEAVPQPGEAIVIEPAPNTVMSGNPAVVALLDRSRIDTAAGQREAAGASLERALRIEPRNAWLWNELAQLRLTQGQYMQAITLAQKSNSFAGRERRLQAMNWKVIGNARVAQGNSAGAEQAFKRAADLDQAAESESGHGIGLFQ
ncbi:MAG: tetratricopeptide repeat protein [Gammaproteobacteria bacterium]|nr:tetratricopeptide repeat protein [Gammaproteobacteria bacterium]MBU1481647.1 tetratricopeptide repeat protein [Gammaproteobacteria bacterium]